MWVRSVLFSSRDGFSFCVNFFFFYPIISNYYRVIYYIIYTSTDVCTRARVKRVYFIWHAGIYGSETCARSCSEPNIYRAGRETRGWFIANNAWRGPLCKKQDPSAASSRDVLAAIYIDIFNALVYRRPPTSVHSVCVSFVTYVCSFIDVSRIRSVPTAVSSSQYWVRIPLFITTNHSRWPRSDDV